MSGEDKVSKRVVASVVYVPFIRALPIHIPTTAGEGAVETVTYV